MPDDPYYKLRLQAELNYLEKVPKPYGQPEIPSPIRHVNTWAARNRTTLRKASEAAAYSVLRPQPVHSATVAAPQPIVPAPSPVPATAAVDSLVAFEQVENEDWLRLVAPAAVVEFKVARNRLEEAADLGGYEQYAVLAQALESIRRVMDKLADGVCPPEPGPVSDRLGKECPTHDRAYKARINLALQRATNSVGAYRLGKRELELHHQRLTELVDRISAGVHGEGDFAESRQLYTSAWQIVAICRLHLPIQDFPLSQHQLPAGGWASPSP